MVILFSGLPGCVVYVAVLSLLQAKICRYIFSNLGLRMDPSSWAIRSGIERNWRGQPEDDLSAQSHVE